jgi:ABC-2 type transport system ATP-binding protein
MLRLEKVQKQYGSFTALNIDTFTIDDGIVWLQGENGSGKTTLLKMIAGLLPFEGDITVNETYSIKKQRRQFVSLVNYGETEPLYPEFLTAEELVKLYCHAKGGSVQQAEELLQQLHVFDAYNKSLAAYSSGMIKKLSLVLAFIGSPRWILLDEPLVTMDVASVETICTLIQNRHRQGTSFLITSHQAFYAGQLSFTSSLLVANHVITKTS